MTIVFVGAAGLGREAAAFDGLELEARGGVGVGAMLSSDQRDRGFKTGYVPDLRPALRVGEMIAAELAVASWFFPRDGGTGRATMLGAGLRCDPRLTGWLSWFVDGHGGVGLTGQANRFMVDAGTGLEVWLSRNLAVGPFVRYGQIVDSGPDPKFWAAGLYATMTLAGGSDEPPSLGDGDRDRDERQREWERARQRERSSPRQRDRDRDGIVDAHDICPDEKPGPNPDPNMAGCPRQETGRAIGPPSSAPADSDRDGDGVPDRDDQCPTRPFGSNPDPLAIGCPLADRDRDGVPDIQDACPTRPGVPDGQARTNGCPGLVRIDRGMIVLSKPISFSGHGDSIQSGSLPVLQAVAGVLKATPGIRKVSVESHTDASLPAGQSLALSERRAEAVRRWLVSNGVEDNRLITRGHGDTRPMASNFTAKGRAANIRVELIIVDPSDGAGLP